MTLSWDPVFFNWLGPLRDNMSVVRYLANISLSFIARLVFGLPLTEFHSGFRVYSKKMIETLMLEKNSNGHLFSFEIIAQAKYFNLKICQVPVRCDYKSEHTSMKIWKGLPAILHTIYTVLLYRLALLKIKRGIFAS